MFFSPEVEVSAGVADTSPQSETITLTAGVVESISIKFLAGCRHTVKVRIKDGSNIIAPSGDGEYITGDNEVVEVKLNRELKTSNQKLIFEFSSPDAGYDHKIYLRINITPSAEYSNSIEYLQAIIDTLTRGD